MTPHSDLRKMRAVQAKQPPRPQLNLNQIEEEVSHGPSRNPEEIPGRLRHHNYSVRQHRSGQGQAPASAPNEYYGGAQSRAAATAEYRCREGKRSCRGVDDRYYDN